MCGHVSVYYKNKKDVDIKSMIDKIDHRGPNFTGYFRDDKIDLAFKRLSIIDIEGGAQPFEKDDKVIVFNGEIYNYKELKKELIEKGHNFLTKSDTEVLLTSYIEYGKDCLQKLRGMFAFVIYDKKTSQVFGARDIFGIKPLYYIDNQDFISFASEYKSIINLLDNVEVDTSSLQSYLSFQFVPNNKTMIKGINLVPPGYCFSIINDNLTFEKYFEVDLTSKKNINAKDVQNVIVDSISRHMEANVAVGTFLSGGIDSSIVATIASSINPNIKSFSIGFEADGYNELEVAKKTADELKIENIQIKVNQDEYIKSLPDVVYHLDDPVADPSEVGIYFLSKEARKHVTVVLSGEGADELFGGYNIYKEYKSLMMHFKMPEFLRKTINNISKKMPNIKGKNYLYRISTPLRDRYIGNAKIFENEEIKNLLITYKPKYDYQNVISHIYDDAQKFNYDYVTTMQHVDINTWLIGDILQKGDKMSMASSIELRVPYLDKDVLSVSKNLKLNQKISNNNTKVLLREAFKNLVPKHVLEKKKLGFPTPIRVWLKSDLGKVVRDTILDSKVDNYINKDYIIKLLDEHIDGKKDNSRKVWTVYIFCLWHQIFIENKEIKY